MHQQSVHQVKREYWIERIVVWWHLPVTRGCVCQLAYCWLNDTHVRHRMGGVVDWPPSQCYVNNISSRFYELLCLTTDVCSHMFIQSSTDHIRSESYYLFLSVIVVTHSFSKWIFEKGPPLSILSLSRRSSSLIVKQDKKKSTTLSYHCFRSKTYICTNFVCRSYYTTNHQFIFKMSWKVCMINHWFCYFEINFFSQLSKWNDVR